MVKRFNNDGFTLIELLVVISIIAVLTGILVPCIGKAKAIAKRTVCRSHLRGATVALRMYLDDNNHVMPPAPRLPSQSDKPPIAEFLKPFIKNPETLLCPADDGHRRPGRTERYFDTEGSSYGYLEPMGGERVVAGYLTGKVVFSEEKVLQREIQVLYDYTNFHGKKGRNGSVNYLYVDWHIGDRIGN